MQMQMVTMMQQSNIEREIEDADDDKADPGILVLETLWFWIQNTIQNRSRTSLPSLS